MDARVPAIAARAATLPDRLGPYWRPDEHPAGRALAETRLERWRERVGPGFETRLGWIGQDVERVLPRLGEGAFEALPDWCSFLDAAMARRDEMFVEASRHPFGPVLAGFSAEAVDGLPAAWGEAFAPAAASTLIDDLFNRLCHLAAPALQIEFAGFRGDVRAGSARFEAFVMHMADGALWDFLAEYAALTRLLAIAAAQWTTHVGAIASDFLADRVAIAEHFGGRVPDRIEAIEPSLSDAHNEGRSVAIVTLSGGLQLAYKPRSVGIEAAWFALLAQLDGQAGEFHTLAVLDRGTRGWVELARHRPCTDAEDYYRRAGNLLALLYATEASDCFHENIVADGNYPVLIDMETLMHPLVRPAEASAADDVLFDSVLRAGLLPVWEAGRDNVVVDISGLGAAARQTTPYLRRRWSDLNRDAMALHHEAIVVDSVHHLPMLDGCALRVADHVDAVVHGFRQTYLALIAQREGLLAPGGPIAAMAAQTLRLVFHPTRLYGLMHKRLASPRAMRSGVERSIEFDVLARFYVGSPVKARFHALLGAELAALERGDIPYFAYPADATDLPVPGGGPIVGAFAESGVARVAARLRRMGPDDLALQAEFTRTSLVLSAAMAHAAPFASDCYSDAAPASDADLLSAAHEIGRTLRTRAISLRDGSVTWIAPQLLPHATRYELRPLRLDLYGGQAGVALFLTALAHRAGEGADLAHAALMPLRRGALPALARLLATGHTIGAATGLGSIVYVLTRCAALLGCPDLLEDALAAAAMLDDSTIAADIEHDVMAGAAGAALGMLALHRATADANTLRTARRCGDHLLARAQPMAGGTSWPSGQHPPTTGLSHGAAGIALALARLADASGDARYAAGAEQALRFERSAFDPGQRNWRDLRDGTDAPPAFMNAWCHGALGIGLARTAMQGGDHADDIAAAVALDRAGWLGGKDGLCCGNMARTDLLLTAGDDAAARTVVGGVLQRQGERGQFALAGTDLFDPSFFQGLSGIGYQLLRLSDPAVLPSVLTWD